MKVFYQNVEKILRKKNPILISNVDVVEGNNYVFDVFIKKDKKKIYFTFSKYLEKYGDATDLYEIYDHKQFLNFEELIIYMDEKYEKYECFLDGILNTEYGRYLK